MKEISKYIIRSKTYLFFLLIVILSTICFKISNTQSDFIKYINEDKFKHYKNGLFLGMFNSQKDAEEFLEQKTVNPITLERYDIVFAFGMSGNTPWVKAWEITRVVSDNLFWSPLTNYSKLEGIAIDNLVAHSNANDVASEAIKAGILKVDNFISIAPPAGFRNEAKNLPSIKSVEIYRTKGDPVAEILGEKTIAGILQKFGDLNIGILNKANDLIIGVEITKPWPDKVSSPNIKERIFEGSYYFIDKPHHYKTNANNIALEKMYTLDRTIRTADPKVINETKISEFTQKLEDYRSKFPDTIKKFDVSVPELSGVCIDPNPLGDGKGNSAEIKKKVIESRPSDDALHWEVK